MAQMIGWLRQQSTHSGIVMLALLILAARAAGIDVALLADSIAKEVAAVAATLGALSAAAKMALPDVPPPSTAERATEALERAIRTANIPPKA